MKLEILKIYLVYIKNNSWSIFFFLKWKSFFFQHCELCEFYSIKISKNNMLVFLKYAF